MKTQILLLLLIIFSLFAHSQTSNSNTNLTPAAGKYFESDYNSVLNKKFTNNRAEGYDSLNVSHRGSWGEGNCRNIISSGIDNIVFIASGSSVIILNVAEIIPVEISTLTARSIVDHMYYDAEKKHLYLAAYFSGFEIWDLTNFETPERLCRKPTIALPRGGIYAKDNYLYVLTINEGIVVYDITNPDTPVYQTTCSISGYVWNFHYNGNYLYLSTEQQVTIVDISTAGSPVVRSSYSCSPRGIYADNNYLYVADNTGLIILDINNPDNITLKSSYAVNNYPMDIIVEGQYAYLACSNIIAEPGIFVFDIQDIENPAMESITYYWAAAICINNNKMISVANSQVIIYNMTDPANLELASFYNTPRAVYDIAISNDYAFVASNGLKTIDITDKTKPTELSSFYANPDAELVDISGTTMALLPENFTHNNNSLTIIDISTPEDISLLGTYNNLELPREVIIKDDYVYTANWWAGFNIIDISNPVNPTLVTNFFRSGDNQTPGEDWCYVSDIDVQGDYLYAIDYKPHTEDTKGLYIFNISNPEAVELISRFDYESRTGRTLKVEGDYAYIADADGAVEIIDIYNPKAPSTLSRIEMPYEVYNLDVSNGYVYAACYINGGVQVIDVSVPTNPFLHGYYAKSGLFALNVTTDEDNIYIADADAGFQIYKHDMETREIYSVTFSIADELEPDISIDGYNTHKAILGNATFSHVVETESPGREYTVELDGYNTITDNVIVDENKIIPIVLTPLNIINNENNDFNIYPNPSNGKFIIEGQDIINIKIVDISGKVILDTNNKIQKKCIDISNMPSAIYFAKIITKNGSFTEKIILSPH